MLSQLQLSEALGVSRTPLREAMRMLQEEGLIDAEPNQRPSVKGFDSSDLESVYSTRILLESFAVALTIPTLTEEDIREAEEALGGMRERHADTRTSQNGATPIANFTACSFGVPAIRTIQLIELQAEKAERYLRFYQLRDTHSWWSRDTAAEHRDLLATITRDQKGSRDSVAAVARHLARTALWVIAEAEPERDPLPIRLALQMALSTATSDPQTGHAHGEPELNSGDGEPISAQDHQFTVNTTRPTFLPASMRR